MKNHTFLCLSNAWLACGIVIGSFSIFTTSVHAQNGRMLPPQLPGTRPSTTQSNAGPNLSELPSTLPSPGSRSNAAFQPALNSPLNPKVDDPTTARQEPSFQSLDRNSQLGSQLSSDQVLSSGQAQLDMCTVQLIQKIELPANEPGPLSELLVTEGLAINQGQIIAKVDDEKAKTELSVAAAKLEASQLKIGSDIEIRYAQAGYDAAAKVYERERRLAGKGVGTESAADEARLTAIQSQLQIEKARHDFSVNQKSITVEKLQVLQAKELLKRHAVIAPWGGIIRKIFKHQGEWTNAGDPIVEMIQMDRLWVEGSVRLNQINPYQVSNRPVVVTMNLADGSPVTFQGKIVFVDPEVNGYDYKVRAEVSNRVFQDHWLLIPGMKVQMNVDILPTGPVETIGQQGSQPRG